LEVESPPYQFLFIPLQAPGQVRLLDDIRLDHRIKHHVPAIGIAPTLLASPGEGPFSKKVLYFPRHDSTEKEEVVLTQAILSSYHSGNLCKQDPIWDIMRRSKPLVTAGLRTTIPGIKQLQKI